MADWFWGTESWRLYQGFYLGHEPSESELDPVTSASYVLDLTPPLNEIWEGLSKGHKSSTTQGLRYLEVTEFSNTTWMRGCHERAAGRITRPLATWEMMNLWIEGDNALCLGASGIWPANPFAWSYFIRFGEGAYYMSACSEPEYKSSLHGNALMWHAIRRLKGWGYEWLELGEAHTEGIGAFKRHWGARLVGLGERVGNSEYVHAPMASRGVPAVEESA